MNTTRARTAALVTISRTPIHQVYTVSQAWGIRKEVIRRLPFAARRRQIAAGTRHAIRLDLLELLASWFQPNIGEGETAIAAVLAHNSTRARIPGHLETEKIKISGIYT